MSEQSGQEPGAFVVTKGYHLFAEMCDSCRRSRFIGLGYGPPGTGKTESARYYAQWASLEPFLPEPLITFGGRSAVDGLYPYKPLTFASAPLGSFHLGVPNGVLIRGGDALLSRSALESSCVGPFR